MILNDSTVDILLFLGDEAVDTLLRKLQWCEIGKEYLTVVVKVSFPRYYTKESALKLLVIHYLTGPLFSSAFLASSSV